MFNVSYEGKTGDRQNAFAIKEHLRRNTRIRMFTERRTSFLILIAQYIHSWVSSCIKGV